MPVIKSAKKKMRQDKKRESQNQKVKNHLKQAIKLAKIEKSEKVIIAAIRIADKAATNKIIHKNKAARIKSTLANLLKTEVSTPKKLPPKVKRNA